MNLAILEEQDYEKLAQDILEVSETKSEDELFEILGNALYDSGLDVAPESYDEAAIAVTFGEKATQFNILQTLDFVADSEPLAKKEAKKRGKGLFRRIKKAICSNEKIRDFLTGETELKDYLKTGIPVLLGLISSSLTLGPIGLAIATVIIALLIKVGYQKFCGIE